MKILVGVFTFDRNLKVFAKCLDYLLLSRSIAIEKYKDLTIDIIIRDFSTQGNFVWRYINNFDLGCVKLVSDPIAGFGRNFNACRYAAMGGGYDYFININDDAFIHGNFIYEAIKFMEKHKGAGFVGGTSNLGSWLLDPDDVDMPTPKPGSHAITNFNRLWWECSAGCYRVSAMSEIGIFDEFLSERTGYLADNEYLLRLFLAGWKLFRNNRMTFFHVKGQTQHLFRTPGMRKDVIRERGKEYLKLKWNLDIDNQEEQVYYRVPFNGKIMSVINTYKISLDGEEYPLTK